VLPDGYPCRLVGGKRQRTLPRLDGFVSKTGLLIEDGKIFDRGEVLRVHAHRSLELAHGVEHLTLATIQQAELEPETKGQRIDGNTATQVVHGLVEAAGPVRFDALRQATFNLRGRIRYRRRPVRGLLRGGLGTEQGLNAPEDTPRVVRRSSA
jgi:hypothetical protein